MDSIHLLEQESAKYTVIHTLVNGIESKERLQRRDIADIITTGEDPIKIGKFSEWQNGPEFMELPIENWPIN